MFILFDAGRNNYHLTEKQVLKPDGLGKDVAIRETRNGDGIQIPRVSREYISSEVGAVYTGTFTYHVIGQKLHHRFQTRRDLIYRPARIFRYERAKLRDGPFFSACSWITCFPLSTHTHTHTHRYKLSLFFYLFLSPYYTFSPLTRCFVLCFLSFCPIVEYKRDQV